MDVQAQLMDEPVSVDDALAERLSQRMSPSSRWGVAALLRTMVEDLESGVLDAQGVLVVLMCHDEVNRPVARGIKRSSWRMLDALTDARDWAWAGHYSPDNWDADEASTRRKANRASNAAREKREADEEARAKPFLCACEQRFASDRGHTQHARIRARGYRATYGPDGVVALPKPHVLIAVPWS